MDFGGCWARAQVYVVINVFHRNLIICFQRSMSPMPLIIPQKLIIRRSYNHII